MANVLEILFGVKNAGLRTGLAEAKGMISRFRQDAGSQLGQALTFGGVGAAAKSVVDYADRIADLSQVYGVSTTALAQWGQAAEENASSAEAVAKALQKVTVTQSDALSGNLSLRSEFAALGVTMEDLQSMGPDQILAKIGKGSMDASAIVKVLGRNAVELRPLLEGIAQGTIQLGAAMDEETIHRLAAFSDSIKTITQNLRVMTGEIMGETIKAIQWVGAAMGGVSANLTNATEEILRGRFKQGWEQLWDPAAIKGTLEAMDEVKQGANKDAEIKEAYNTKELGAAWKKYHTEQDRLSVMQEQERVGEAGAKRMATELDYQRKLADIEKDIAEARREGNDELENSLQHLKEVTAEQQKIATDAASAALAANGGVAPTQAQLRARAREQAREVKQRQQFRDRLEANGGLVPTKRDINGNVIEGLDPVTGEKRKVDPNFIGPVKPGAGVGKAGPAGANPVEEKLDTANGLLKDIKERVDPLR